MLDTADLSGLDLTDFDMRGASLPNDALEYVKSGNTIANKAELPAGWFVYGQPYVDPEPEPETETEPEPEPTPSTCTVMQERRGLCLRDESTANAASKRAADPTPVPTVESASDQTGSADPSVENNPIVSGVGRGILIGPKANLKGHDLSGFNLVDNAAGLSLVGVKSGGTTTNAETKLPDGWAGWNGYLLGQEAKLTADADLSRIDPNNKNVELSFRGNDLNFEGMHAKAADCTQWTIQSFNLNMSNAYLKGANFEEIILESGREEITFAQANLVRASFKNAKSMIGGSLSPIAMNGADLRHASFKGALNMTYVDFTYGDLFLIPLLQRWIMPTSVVRILVKQISVGSSIGGGV